MIDEHELDQDNTIRCTVCDGDYVIPCPVCDGMGCFADGFHHRENRQTECRKCEGRGYVVCPHCQGSGEEPKT
jgi:DnaJ-class molecular chaperone